MKNVKNVERCPRCGGNHQGMVFAKLEKPIIEPHEPCGQPFELSHWALCPMTGEPILTEEFRGAVGEPI